MAERVVVVRLKAVIDDYQKAMGKAGQATQDVAKSADKWKSLGQSTARIGDSLSRNVTLPIVAVGAAATKMAADFDTVFTQMTTLAGVSAGEIDGLKESVLGLASETGRGPQELAEALYFIRSAGLAGQDALDALEVSAKGAAIGMGSTVQIADAVTNAMAGYGAENLSAAEAMDVLTASVQQGKSEASEMAPQFGRLVPIAAELGVTFQDVGGGLAYLTRSSGDAAQSSTQLSGILQKLLRPSQQGADALRRIGIEGNDLRQMLADQGLLGTLTALRERLGDNGFQLLFDDAQALQGALQFTGASAEDAREVMDALAASAGTTDNAFSKWADSMGAENARAFADLQVAMIKFGEIIAPIASDLISFLGGIAEALASLAPWQQKAIVGFLAFAAALGPIMSVGGRLVSVYGSTTRALASMSSSMGVSAATMSRMQFAAGLLTKTLAGVAIGLTAIELITGHRAARAEGWVEEQIGDVDTSDLRDVRDALREAREELDELDNREGKGRLFSIGGANIFATGGDADRQERIDQLRESIAELEDQEESLAGQNQQTASSFVGADGAIAGMSEETANLVNGLQELSDALAAQFDPLFGLTDALTGVQDAQRAVHDAQQALNEARASGDPDAIAEAERNLAQAQRDSVGSALDAAGAASQLAAGIEAGTVSLADARSQMQTWVEQGLITQSTADAMGARFDAAALQAIALGNTDPNVEVTETGAAPTRSELRRTRDAVFDVPTRRNTHASTSGTGPARRSLDDVTNAANRIPSGRRVRVTTTTGGTVSAIDAVTSAVNRVPRNVTISIGYREYGTAERNRAAALTGRRASGGPVGSGRLYEVAEQGKAELLEMSGRTYLIPGSDGNVVPASRYDSLSAPMASAAAYAGGGGGTTVVNIDMRGALTPNGPEVEKAVFRAISRGHEHGRTLTARGRKL